jgi:hypothetical protein
MKGRGQGFVALALSALAGVGTIAAGRLGPVVPDMAPSPAVRSSEWLCAHGGGEGWTGTIAIANPGGDPLEARITSLDAEGAASPSVVEVPAGGQVLSSVAAGAPESATYVEVFGGWAAVGWLVRAGDPPDGLGAEPCAPGGARSWLTTGSGTERGESALLVVMNPYAVDAVFDVTIYQPDEPPYRDPEWTDIELKPGSSVALRLDKKVPGKDVVATLVEVKSGRVGVATLGISEGGGVRSVLGSTEAASSWFLGTAWGAAQSSVLLFVPGDDPVPFSATVSAADGPRAIADLSGTIQTGQSTRSYPITASGPSVVTVRTDDGSVVVASLRSEGQSQDDAATGVPMMPGRAWVVPPTVAGEPSYSGLIVANPGDVAATVVLRPLTQDGPGSSTTFTLAPGAVLELPPGLLAAHPDASILILSDAPVLAMGASTSGGPSGLSLYGVAAGVPIPGWALPRA